MTNETNVQGAALLASLSTAAAQPIKRRVIKTLADVQAGAARALIDGWRAKRVPSDQIPLPETLVSQISGDAVAQVTTVLASLGAAIAGATVTADNVTVSARGSVAILRLTVQDEFSGASATVSVRYSDDNPLGAALASVAPQVKGN